jgi:hypothetical protein
MLPRPVNLSGGTYACHCGAADASTDALVRQAFTLSASAPPSRSSLLLRRLRCQNRFQHGQLLSPVSLHSIDRRPVGELPMLDGDLTFRRPLRYEIQLNRRCVRQMTRIDFPGTLVRIANFTPGSQRRRIRASSSARYNRATGTANTVLLPASYAPPRRWPTALPSRQCCLAVRRVPTRSKASGSATRLRSGTRAWLTRSSR